MADIDAMVKIDAKTHAVLAKIPVPGATFLKDPGIVDDGAVYVSQTIASRI